jgi:hypothetical protein
MSCGDDSSRVQPKAVIIRPTQVNLSKIIGSTSFVSLLKLLAQFDML